MRLTHVYWCHAAGERDPGAAEHPPGNCLMPTAALAMEWMRASVRTFAGGLDHRPFLTVWRWLSDRDALDATERRLLDGEDYSFGVDTDFGHYAWTVHPVLALPLIEE